MDDPTAGQPTVTVSRLFWVAAANALRKVSGHATSDEPQMTDEEAWQYVIQVARSQGTAR